MRLFLRKVSGRASRHLTKDGKLVVLENQFIIGKGMDPGDNEYSLKEEKDESEEEKVESNNRQGSNQEFQAEERRESNQKPWTIVESQNDTIINLKYLLAL